MKFLLATCLMFLSAPAMAEDSTTIRFRDGSAYVFTQTNVALDGRVTYRVTQGEKPASIERFDVEKSMKVDDQSGELSCFEMDYDRTTDLLKCSNKDDYAGWYFHSYRGTRNGMQLQRLVHQTLDDPETKTNEAKETTLFERNK